ncbi:hypothetical protein COO60DRAFT_1628738 [Scenedesmus sp. NREL 46B-D3]|nr:hypothetical protein COO60DRAFT_1628738 [Scenedesmus sp. NREL 46B-D3]
MLPVQGSLLVVLAPMLAVLCASIELLQYPRLLVLSIGRSIKKIARRWLEVCPPCDITAAALLCKLLHHVTNAAAASTLQRILCQGLLALAFFTAAYMLCLLVKWVRPFITSKALRLRLRVVARLFGLSLCVLTGAADEQAMAMFLALDLDLTTKEGMAYVPEASYKELEAKHKEKSSRMSYLVRSLFAPYGALDRMDAAWVPPPLCGQDSSTTAVTPGGAATATSGPSYNSADTDAPRRQRKRCDQSPKSASATASPPGPVKSANLGSSSSNAANAGPAPRPQRKLRSVPEKPVSKR